MEISRNGNLLVATAYGDDHTTNCIRVWNLHDSTYETQRGGFHNVLAESNTTNSQEDAFLVASVYQPDSFHVWSSASQNNRLRQRNDVLQHHHHPEQQQEQQPPPPSLLQERRRFSNAYPHELAFSTDGTMVASVDDFRSIKIWRIQDGKLLSTIYEHDTVSLYAMCVCPNTRTIGAIARTRVGAISRNQNSLRLFQVYHDKDED
jgi:WD40 repeat protein